jgi:Ca-activated chloride channel family protein
MLQWLLILPVLVACWMIQDRYRRRVRHASPIAQRFLALSRRTSTRTGAAVLITAVLCAGAMVFALARPQAIVTARDAQYERQDLIIVLDRSVSMRARDIEPSRLVRATSEIREFLESSPDAIGRVALVGFANSALVLSYPTEDLGSLFFYLDWIEEDTTPLFGTNMGGALIQALTVIEEDERETQKLLLLISDGEDFGAELIVALDRLRAAGLEVHCIGVGSDAPVPIPLDEGEESFVLDEAGSPVLTRFSEATLRRIAETTGGRYVRSSTGSELAEAIGAIVQGERRLVGWRTETEYRELYVFGLAVALVAGAVLWLIL